MTMVGGLLSPVERFVREFGRITLMFAESVYWGVRRPFKLDYIFKQMEFIGVNSTIVVIITGMFTGMVLALQSYYGFRKFGAEGLVGATVALSMTRELGPVLTSLMVTGRAGSAMAAQLGTMRVTEQIDALTVMALSPIKYLVTPRIIAGFLMLPVLTVVSDFIGVVGGYVVGVKLLGINEGAFIDKMIKYVELNDIYNGLVKSAVFGIILSTVACYKGFYARGGAEGVGKATTEAVVVSSVTILMSDYILTSLMF
ncbi:MAG: putative phospholipid ABC transporter permease protein MlaE [Syntrophorhabdus sp. PtaU1.Bin002]|nr:MAG: putative phospholipid ABC transporter permease protein MlaE [Syntrophorhabdus sp. PtaU1.Bin002]